VPNGPHVDVRFRPIELFLRHDVCARSFAMMCALAREKCVASNRYPNRSLVSQARETHCPEATFSVSSRGGLSEPKLASQACSAEARD
jgi:hypothetical protein